MQSFENRLGPVLIKIRTDFMKTVQYLGNQALIWQFYYASVVSASLQGRSCSITKFKIVRSLELRVSLVLGTISVCRRKAYNRVARESCSGTYHFLSKIVLRTEHPCTQVILKNLKQLPKDYITATEKRSKECKRNLDEFKEDGNHIEVLRSTGIGIVPGTEKKDRVRQENFGTGRGSDL